VAAALGLLLAAAAFAWRPLPAGSAAPPGTAYDFAVRISSWGQRPAASAAEARAHRLVERTFRAAGLRVAVQEFAVPGRGRSRNVIGVLDTPATCLRIAMAHTDSAPPAPGANDNASGVAVVAVLARRLREIEPGCDVWLVATGAEERIYTGSPDHLGALALARRARARGARDRLEWALSLDEVGRDRPFWLRSPAFGVRPKVEGALLRAARHSHVPLSWVRDEGTGNSDHREFQLLGLPGLKLGVAGDDPCRHTPCDSPSRLQARAMRGARRLLEGALQRTDR
jgi:aminopeptidase YwaD